MGGNYKIADIPLGTMIRGGAKTKSALERFIPIGIETIELFFWDRIPEEADLNWMEGVAALCRRKGIGISSLALYANPLRDLPSKEKARADFALLLEMAAGFDIPVIAAFTGRVPGHPVEDSYEGIRSFFSPIADLCVEKRVKLAFENCPMDGNRESGDWNIAFHPEIWEDLFREIFPDPVVGLEFDPAHLPVLGLSAPQLLEQWLPRIHHIHGKDALPSDPRKFCFPGKGVCDWEELFHILCKAGYGGTVDMEGYHGTFVSHDREIEEQRGSLDYLKLCRTGC